MQDAENLQINVTPAKAGVQEILKRLESCFHLDDNAVRMFPRNDGMSEKDFFRNLLEDSLHSLPGF